MFSSMVWLFQYYIKYLALVFCIESIVYMVQYDTLFVIIIVFWINETLYSDGTRSGFRKPVLKTQPSIFLGFCGFLFEWTVLDTVHIK